MKKKRPPIYSDPEVKRYERRAFWDAMFNLVLPIVLTVVVIVWMIWIMCIT